jgi:predicted transposase YdaD
MPELGGVAVENWLNVEMPEVRNTRVDLLGETADGSLIHVELQSSNDPQMPLRMAEYCLRVYRRFGKFPRQIVLYVGEEPLRMEAELRGPDQWFRYQVTDVRDLNGERLLESDAFGDNVIAILTRWDDSREAVRRIVAKLAVLPLPERDEAMKQLLILSGLRGLEEVVMQETSKMPVLKDIRQHKVLGPEFERATQEGVQQGLQQGVQQGVQQGAHQEASKLLRRLIQKRFGALPVWAEQRIANRSLAELEELTLRVLNVHSLEELLT